MFKDTLIVLSRGFGRAPYAQGDDGRDHNNKGFTSWLPDVHGEVMNGVSA